MHSKNTLATLGLALIDIQKNSPLGSTGKAVEAVVCREYLLTGSQVEVVLSHETLRKETGYATVTLRNAVNAMVESGRWAVVPGTGVFTSTYQPLFLRELLATTGKDD